MLRLDAERALVLTTDFFPPIVDDPRWFGRIAAANAMSDVFAMGGEVLAALNLVGWPEELDLELLAEMLAGGLDKVREAGAALAGGHSVKDHEIKYGLAVTGLVHPSGFWRNRGARAGDVVLLTKPLGMGAVSTALKRGMLDDAPQRVLAAMEQMATLNLAAARALRVADVHAATDVSGYGLVGHGLEMAAAELTLEIDTAALPLFDGALDLARAGAISGGGQRARRVRAPTVEIAAGIDDALLSIVFDAETSGGLLAAIAVDEADRALRALADAGVSAAVIGRFVARRERAMRLLG